MKNSHLYFGFFLITFAVNTSAMEQSGCSELAKLEVLQNQVKQSRITRTTSRKLLDKFSDIDLTNIKMQIQKLEAVNKVFPYLFDNNYSELNSLYNIILGHNKNGKGSVIVTVSGKNGPMEFFPQSFSKGCLLYLLCNGIVNEKDRKTREGSIVIAVAGQNGPK